MSYIEWEWASHQPMIKAVMELYHPEFVLELGIGNFSTPIFQQYDVKHMGVENDPTWIHKMKEIYPRLHVRYHNPKFINIDTPFDNLTFYEKLHVSQYYERLPFQSVKPNLLFVDQFDCFRVLSINALKKRFNYIIYHDCHPQGYGWYRWDLLNMKGFNRYYLKTPLAWTGLLVEEESDKGLRELQEVIEPFIAEFQEKYMITGLKLEQ